MPTSHAVLRRLLAADGDVVSRGELLQVLPGGSLDEHAVETAVARLRAALPDKALGGDRREAGLPPGVTPRHTPWDAYAAGLSTAPTARR